MVYTPVGWANDTTHPLSQANMKNLDAGLVSAHQGWRPISDGVEATTGQFTIAVPAGYEHLRLKLRGHKDAVGDVAIRVNEDSTAELHRWFLIEQPAEGSDTKRFASATAWRVAEWSTVPGALADATLWRVTGGLDVSFNSTGVRQGTVASTHKVLHGAGKLTAGRTVTSLQVISITAGVSFTECEWWLEGYLIP